MEADFAWYSKMPEKIPVDFTQTTLDSKVLLENLWYFYINKMINLLTIYQVIVIER